MEENKPNQTDPSVSAVSPDDKSDTAIQERLANAVAQQKSGDNPAVAQPVEPKPEGGKGSDVTSQKDSSVSTDPNAEVLKLFEASTGRKFDNVDDAKKYLTNLNSLVGDQSVAKARESAKLYDTLVNKFAAEKGIAVEEAKRFWADTLVQETAQPVSKPKSEVVEDQRISEMNTKVDKLEAENQKFSLLYKYPYAAEIQGDIAIVAKQKGITQLEAFEQSPFKPLLEKKAAEEAQKSPVVTPSNRLGFDQQKVQELGSRVLKAGNEDDKVALVTEMLGSLLK